MTNMSTMRSVAETLSVLCAVEANRELAVETQEWVQKLKDAVYNADDLFDEILTVAAQTKGRFHRNNKLPDKGGVGDIHSRINARNDVIVGRKDDMNAVIDLLFDTNLKDGVSFITIEGVRGLGKTALAQLVYRDQRVEDEFPLRLWVQFSNGDEGRLSANEILGKILEAAGRFYTEIDDLLNIELTEQLRGKKYLIVLDDVCGKDQEEWLALRKFLMFSVGGSRIIVTTCSTDTTRAIGNEHRYEFERIVQREFVAFVRDDYFWDGQKHGEVVSCKVHTLMHDVSLDVGAQEICVVDSIVDNVTNHVLHLHHIGNECMDKLTCLHTLTAFEVSEVSTSEEECSSEDDSSSNREEAMGMLKDLKALTNLRGSISISIPEVSVDFRGHEYGDELAINHEDLLEKLAALILISRGTTVGISRYEFYKVVIQSPKPCQDKDRICQGLQHLSLLSKLQYLKSLTLSSMSNLIYMDTMSSTSSSDYAQAPSEFTFFPSLEELSISYSPKLKGWWEGDQQLVAVDGSCWQPSFKRLFKLSILVCPKLESFPPCPRVKTLSLSDLDENFKIMESRDSNGNNNPRPSALKKVERLSQVKEAFKSCSSSLRRLTIRGCDNLMSVSQGLEYLTVLESLSIIECPVLTFSEEDDNNEDDAMPWRSLHQSLRSLELCKVESMTILPSGMQYLTALQDLNIECCWELKDLPEWIGCLSSLRSLRVRCCSEFQSLPETMQNLTSLKLLDLSYCKEGLKERCQNPNGVDWHKIKHISSIIISE
ncbi:Disease resistance protein RGA2 [Bienertia sinuspersici]